jgi:predicted permease
MTDVRYAIRTLLRSPGFTATAILSLALGIGANTAVFSVVNGVMLRPLPFAQPERLVQLHGSSPLVPRGDAVSSLADYRDQSASFEALVGYDVSARFLRTSAGPQRVTVVRAERGFFPMLDVAAIVGRAFGDDDPANVAVVSERFWRQRLRGSAAAIGSTTILDDQPIRIVGVMPDSFQFPYKSASILSGVASQSRTDMWLPIDPPVRGRGRFSNVTGRLKVGVTLAAANAELAGIAQRLQDQYPAAARPRGVYAVPLDVAVVDAGVRRPLVLLFAAVALVLLLACANMANLSLVRATLRSREVAVRAALGAGRRRLAAQFLTESLLLSFAGGIVGVAIAWAGTNRLMSLVRAHLPRAHEVGLDWTVFLFLFAACIVTGLVFGLAPAIIAMRTNPHAVLQEAGSHGTAGVGSTRLRDGLVVMEVALAFILAVGAALLVRELGRLKSTRSGMATENIVTFHLGRRVAPGTDARRFYDIADRVKQLPGVSAAGFTQLLPLQNWGWTSNSTDFRVRGRETPATPPFQIELRYVTPGYFDALGVVVQRGRAFTASDDRAALPVIMINETLARRTFGGEDPIGKETTRGTIVGIVADVRQVHLDQPPAPEVYYPAAQNWSQVSELGMTLVVRTLGRPEGVIDAVRSAVRQVDPNQAVFNVRTMESVVEDSLAEFTLYLRLMALFAIIALLIAVTGTYGVIAYVATSRMREFAIRIALGADGRRVTTFMLRKTTVLTVLGIVAGAMASIAATPLLANLPVTIRPPDASVMVPVAALVIAAALIASWVPARRAAGADPMLAIRGE